MHTPQGHEIIDGRVVPVDWIAVIFNPSFPYRLAHMVTATYLATALMVGGSTAWHLLRDRATEPVRVMLSMALWMLLATAPLQAFIGDAHGLNTLEYQPAKLAAIEGHWENHHKMCKTLNERLIERTPMLRCRSTTERFC